MDADAFRSMLDVALAPVREELAGLKSDVGSLKSDVGSLKSDVGSLRDHLTAAELRLAESGRMMFRQLTDIYRATLEKIEHLEKHLGERIDHTRGALEALRSSLERQDFRSDELGRRITALETRQDP